jgi:hypothetical protein
MPVLSPIADCPNSGIDIIGDDDIVTARLGTCPVVDEADPESVPSGVAPKEPLPSDALSDSTERFRIRFFTAEHAVVHARQAPKDQSEPKNGIFAFDGEPVNGSISLVRGWFNGCRYVSNEPS